MTQIAKNKVGRPTVFTPQVLDKLKEAYLMDCTDQEACLNAEISPDALYKYQRENPEYIKKKQLFKQNPFLVARKSVVRGMPEDPNLALKYLERKKKDEFAPQSNQTTVNVMNTSIEYEKRVELLQKAGVDLTAFQPSPEQGQLTEGDLIEID